jgi:hypothetical protein
MVLAISSISISLAADNAGNLMDMSTNIPESGQIYATQTKLLNATNDANISSFLFVLTWLNATSKLEATLIAPSGIKIDSATQPPVTYEVNKSLIFYILPNAEVGKWTAIITAKDVPDRGESYWALFSRIPENEYLENTGEEIS